MSEKNKEKTYMEELRKMAEVDIKTVDRSSLVDINDVKILEKGSHEEKVKDYIKQIKNPYCYLCNGVVVKISFSGKESLEDCLVRGATL